MEEYTKLPSAVAPSVPITVESGQAEVQTIQPTELNLDEKSVPSPSPLPKKKGKEISQKKRSKRARQTHLVEVKPKLINRVQPQYPKMARRTGMEGMVVLRLLVGKDGKVRQAKVLKGEKIFVEAALKAAEQFEFKPAEQNGRPVRVWVSLPVRFKLK